MATSANFHGDPKGNLSKNFFFSRIQMGSGQQKLAKTPFKTKT